jgi:tRNA threonylcarbamoyladenosine biosynthesis protein TsaB
MTRLLVLDTSTVACSVGLLDGEQITSEYYIAPREHTQLILPIIQRLLSQAGLTLSQLDALAFATGPGSFTGIRLAAGLIQGMAFAADLPVIAVSTLAAIAQRAYQEGKKSPILVATDAYMQEVYWGAYEFNPSQQVMILIPSMKADALMAKTQFLEGNFIEPLTGFTKVGDAWGDEFRCYPDASSILSLAKVKYFRQDYTEVLNIAPNYLRKESAWKKL